MIEMGPGIHIREDEIRLEPIRASGPGGQHVNKVSSALHLRFDIRASSLPEAVKQRLLQMHDRRITRDGIVVIKAQRYRTQELNRADALERLTALVRNAAHTPPKRIPTRPGPGARRRRVESKRRHARIKRLRTRPTLD